MKSGLGDRNNGSPISRQIRSQAVSMKSGLGDRNNPARSALAGLLFNPVSMKSGLGDRNNPPVGSGIPS